jgi:penicillin amidase
VSWTETVVVAGAENVEVELEAAAEGPIIGRDHLGRLLVLRWTAHHPEAVAPVFGAFERARSVNEALTAGASLGIPPQNLVVADRDGSVGWTIAGRIPRRVNCRDTMGTTLCDWRGWLEPEAYPVIKDPEDGIVWTANARVVGGEAYRTIGDGGFVLGARSQQIRDGLLALEPATEQDLLAIQLDDRALFLEWWRDLLLSVLEDPRSEALSGREELRKVVVNWSGRAAVDDAGFRCVRAFRLYARSLVLDPLVAPCAEAAGPCGWEYFSHREAVVRRLVRQRPLHLLNPQFDSWHDLLAAAAGRVVEEFSGDDSTLSDHPWGERNTVHLRHPLSRALPRLLSRLLDMPPVALPGDSHMPRVQTPSFGASERFVVSPGREEQGIFHMPVGQSGHPLAPYYGAGHEDWVRGTPSPFLPGPAKYSLELTPGGVGEALREQPARNR